MLIEKYKIIVFCLAFVTLYILNRLYTYFYTVESIIVSEELFLKLKKMRVVISLTTSPSRIHKIEPMINSLMNQTIPPKKIYIHLPYIFKRNNTVFGILPKFITNNPLVIIDRCNDIGPATKIIPMKDIEMNGNTLVLSVDDDIYYSDTIIERFLYYHVQFPDAIITGTSFIEDPHHQGFIDNQKRAFYAQFLEGYSGVLYQMRFLHGFDINYITGSDKSCILGDDLLLSNYFIKKGIPIISMESRSMVKPFEYGLDNDALHTSETLFAESNNTKNYRNCIKYLKAKDDYHLKNINSNSRIIWIKLDETEPEVETETEIEKETEVKRE
jgi:hypothetical protein